MSRISGPVQRVAIVANGVVSFIILAVGSLPISFWFSIYLNATRASRYLGYWPTYGHPDPKTLPEEFWSWPYDFGVPLIVVCVIASVPASIIIKKVSPVFWAPLALSGFVVLVLLGLTVCSLDPGGTLDWYFD